LKSKVVHDERPNGEEPFEPRRLLSPTQAAAYLGLPSRFAIYRLVSNGTLPAVRLANKMRLDLRDLDSAIEEAKQGNVRESARRRDPTRPVAVPRELAPLRKRSVTISVTARSPR
jgi:excisionase family DNA binding protein